MCLDTLDKETRQTEYGYKVFIKENECLLSCYFTIPYKENKWYKSESENKLFVSKFARLPFISDKNQYYTEGFHFFYDKRDAEYLASHFNSSTSRHVVRKVKVRNIVASGTELIKCLNVGVAREMFICREEV